MNPDSTRKNDGYNKAKKIRRTKSTVGNRRDTAYRAADLISKVLAPQPFAFLVVLILAFASPIGTGPILNSLYCFLLGIIFIVFLPVSPVLVAYALGRVDIWVSSRTRRTPFFIFAILIYLIGSLIFFYGKSTAMYAISLSYVFVTLSVAIINLKWKISVHTAGSFWAFNCSRGRFWTGSASGCRFDSVGCLEQNQIKSAYNLAINSGSNSWNTCYTRCLCPILSPAWP